MTRTTITMDGGKELQAALRNMGPELQEVVGQIVEGTGLELRGDIIKRYQSGPASGRVYQKYNPRRTHQASAPGQAPMSDTGRLANATVYKVVDDMTVEVSNDVFYAAWLEYGTTQIAPRPAWRPAVEEIMPMFRSRLETAIARFVK